MDPSYAIHFKGLSNVFAYIGRNMEAYQDTDLQQCSAFCLAEAYIQENKNTPRRMGLKKNISDYSHHYLEMCNLKQSI